MPGCPGDETLLLLAGGSLARARELALGLPSGLALEGATLEVPATRRREPSLPRHKSDPDTAKIDPYTAVTDTMNPRGENR